MSVDAVISELSGVFKIPAPRYDYNASVCGGKIACFEPSTYTIHFAVENPPDGVVAHEVGHAAHSYYDIKAGTREYETFAGFVEQLYHGWKESYGYGGGFTPSVGYPRVLGCPSCGNVSLPNVYPYTQCYSCGQSYSYDGSSSTSSGSGVRTGNLPLAAVFGVISGITAAAIEGLKPLQSRSDFDRTLEVVLSTTALSVLAAVFFA
ncbi:MAG: hypothetical protein QXO47_10115 [Thermoproteota archaeon]